MQPFISAVISKTINVPNDATVAHIEHAQVDGRTLGVQAILVCHDGSKRTQPLNRESGSTETASAIGQARLLEPSRRSFADERYAITHKVPEIAGHEGSSRSDCSTTARRGRCSW